MTNAFNCPERVYEAMQDGLGGPLLAAVHELGPGRVQWAGTPAVASRVSESMYNRPTTWAVDGQRVTHGELLGLWAADRIGL